MNGGWQVFTVINFCDTKENCLQTFEGLDLKQNQHKNTKEKMVAYLRRIGVGTSAHCSRRFHLNVTHFETKIIKRQKQNAKKAGRP